MENSTNLLLRTGDKIQWSNGSGSVLEDSGEMVSILVEDKSGYKFVEIKKSELNLINV